VPEPPPRPRRRPHPWNPADTIQMRVPVLTYHSNNVVGNDYATNDHVALTEDLGRIHAGGFRIVPLSQVVDVRLGVADETSVENAVALCCDDGSWFDWHNLDHPTCGRQKSFANILRDFHAETGAPVHLTSFVIVSPAARIVLDRTCLVGHGWWTDDWWRDAEREGLVAIESHSWDHNHATLPETAQRDGRRGTFRSIDTHGAHGQRYHQREAVHQHRNVCAFRIELDFERLRRARHDVDVNLIALHLRNAPAGRRRDRHDVIVQCHAGDDPIRRDARSDRRVRQEAGDMRP
jgi:hypothetical protein